MNNLPIDKIPPNVTYLQCTQVGNKIGEDVGKVSVSSLQRSHDPFIDIYIYIYIYIYKKIPVKCKVIL